MSSCTQPRLLTHPSHLNTSSAYQLWALSPLQGVQAPPERLWFPVLRQLLLANQSPQSTWRALPFERPHRWLSGERIHLPMQKTWVQSLELEDPLEQEIVTHSSILAWRIPWTEEPGGLQSMGSESAMTK